jgi:hypothetical protein
LPIYNHNNSFYRKNRLALRQVFFLAPTTNLPSFQYRSVKQFIGCGRLFFADKALDIKIDGFIKKPIDPDIITTKVQAILARNSENFPNNNFIQK